MAHGDYFHVDDYTDENGAAATVAARKARKSQLPDGLPEQGDPPDAFAAFLTSFGHLEHDPVVSGKRYGTEGSEAIELVLRSGTEIRWAEQNHLFGPRLQRPFIMVTGHKPRSLSQHEVQLVAWAIIQFASLEENTSEIDEFRDIWVAYTASREEVLCDRRDEKQMRGLLARWKVLATGRADEALPFVLRDIKTGERLVRRLDFTMHVRALRRDPISWPRMHGWAREIGWEFDRLQYRRSADGDARVDAKVFVVPRGWEEQDD